MSLGRLIGCSLRLSSDPPHPPPTPGGHSHQLRACEESRRSQMSLIEVNSWCLRWQVFFRGNSSNGCDSIRQLFEKEVTWLTEKFSWMCVWFRNSVLSKVKRQHVHFFYQAKVSSRRCFYYSLLLLVLIICFQYSSYHSHISTNKNIP